MYCREHNIQYIAVYFSFIPYMQQHCNVYRARTTTTTRRNKVNVSSRFWYSNNNVKYLELAGWDFRSDCLLSVHTCFYVGTYRWVLLARGAFVRRRHHHHHRRASDRLYIFYTYSVYFHI